MKKLAFFIVIVFCYLSVFHASNEVKNTTKVEETINLLNQTMKEIQTKIDSLEKSYDSIHLKQSKLDNERKIWGTTLNRSNEYFAAFIIILLFIFGLVNYKIVSNALISLKTELITRMNEIQQNSLKNEALVFRNMYFSCVALDRDFSAALWASRYLVKKTELSLKDTDNGLISGFIRNFQRVSKVDLTTQYQSMGNEKYDFLSEINKNIQRVLANYGEKLTDEEKRILLEAVQNLYEQLNNSNNN